MLKYASHDRRAKTDSTTDFRLVGWVKLKADQFDTTRKPLTTLTGRETKTTKKYDSALLDSAEENDQRPTRRVSVGRGDEEVETASLDNVPDINTCILLQNIGRGFVSSNVVGMWGHLCSCISL